MPKPISLETTNDSYEAYYGGEILEDGYGCSGYLKITVRGDVMLKKYLSNLNFLYCGVLKLSTRAYTFGRLRTNAYSNRFSSNANHIFEGNVQIGSYTYRIQLLHDAPERFNIVNSCEVYLHFLDPMFKCELRKTDAMHFIPELSEQVKPMQSITMESSKTMESIEIETIEPMKLTKSNELIIMTEIEAGSKIWKRDMECILCETLTVHLIPDFTIRTKKGKIWFSEYKYSEQEINGIIRTNDDYPDKFSILLPKNTWIKIEDEKCQTTEKSDYEIDALVFNGFVKLRKNGISIKKYINLSEQIIRCRKDTKPLEAFFINK